MKKSRNIYSLYFRSEELAGTSGMLSENASGLQKMIEFFKIIKNDNIDEKQLEKTSVSKDE